MNKKKRELLKTALKLLEHAKEITDEVLERESDALDNIPENLQGTDNFEIIEAAVDNLEEAAENIEEAVLRIEEASL